MPTVAFRIVRSRRLFVNHPIIKKELGNSIDREVKPYFLRIFRNISSGWRHGVGFGAKKTITADFVKIWVFPTSNQQIWEWITQGTKGPYPIPKSGTANLRFRTGYQARTRPRNLTYKGSGVATGPWVRKGSVTHPGIEAREFEKTALEEEKAWFSRTVENAWKRAIRAAQSA